MKVTTLGGRGAWPGAGQACSGYLVEHGGYRILIDPGYATLPRLHRHVAPEDVDAVLVSHGHPDHCADLNPLLRARALSHRPSDVLPVLAPTGALDAILAMDRMRCMDAAMDLACVSDGQQVRLGPFLIDFALLPHHVPNLGMRLSTAGGVVAYTGDSGPDHAVVELGRDADLFIIEATQLEPITDEDAPYLCDAATAIRQAETARAARVMLTHLWPTIARHDVDSFLRTVDSRAPVEVATAGRTVVVAG